MASYTPKLIRDVPQVELYIGPTGTGKTHLACNSAPDDDVYLKDCDLDYWDGYNGQKTVVFDEFAGKSSKMPLATLLRYTDRYRKQLNVKFGSTYLEATRIIITTNIHPKEWYDWKNRWEQYNALKRRITKVVQFSDYLVSEEVEKDSFFDPQPSFVE
jgi:hypothetical protein